MESTRAVFVEPGKIELETMPLTENIAADEVLAKVKRLGLCGSDLHLYRGSYGGPHQYPIIPGHEWAGEIVEAGEKVKHFKPGDRVTADASLWCGECKYCRMENGNRNICTNIRKRGLTADGAASEYIRTKAKYLYLVPEGVDDEVACLAEPFAVALQAIRAGMGESPSTHSANKVLVLGSGPLGMSILMILVQAYGFSNVYVSDLNPYRVDLAKQLGGSEYKMPPAPVGNDTSYARLYDIEGFDFIFESTGVSGVFNSAMWLASPRGNIVSLAPISDLALSSGLLVLKSITVSGSIGGTGSFEEALRFLAENPDYYRHLISHRFSLAEIVAALEAQSGESELMKIVLTIQE